MSKGNHYRKLYYIDRFARTYYCRHARENQLHADKKIAKKIVRRSQYADEHTQLADWLKEMNLSESPTGSICVAKMLL